MNDEIITHKDAVLAIIQVRRCARNIAQSKDMLRGHIKARQRLINRLKASKNIFRISQVGAIEGQVSEISQHLKSLRELSIKIGEYLSFWAEIFDSLIPRSTLMDILNINISDRKDLADDDGFTNLVFVHGLEDSAMFRGNDYKNGPLFRCLSDFMNNEMMHNSALRSTMEEFLFGKGGMFEFAPRYQITANGMPVRLPPKLRIADECDIPKCEERP